MKNYNIKITLSDEEIALVKAMTKEGFYGETTFHGTLARMFELQLREDMDLYREELIG